MTKEQIAKRLKEYCEYELRNVEHLGYDPYSATTRCYGAVMFVINIDGFDEKLGKWWDDEMLPKFKKLVYERK